MFIINHLKFDPRPHHRRAIRLEGYDYSLPGAYFVTLVSYERREIFGEILDGEMQLNKVGQIIAQSCEKLPVLYPYVEIVKYVVMPNHYHGIFWIHDFDDRRRGGSRPAPTGNVETMIEFSVVKPMTQSVFVKIKPLGQLIGVFKTISAKQINLLRSTPGTHVWQRNYYDHIIRNDGEFYKIWDYIDTNLQNWEKDSLHLV